jgi:glucose/arabinose dehydrogenase
MEARLQPSLAASRSPSRFARAGRTKEVVFAGIGRNRDVIIGPDDYPYVVLNLPNGTILRLTAVDEK